MLWKARVIIVDCPNSWNNSSHARSTCVIFYWRKFTCECIRVWELFIC